METPQKRQKSWFSSLTGLVSASRNSTQEAPKLSTATPTPKTGASLVNGDRASSRVRLARPAEQSTPPRYSGTFSAPPVESPESPAKRASPTQLAQRKIHDRVQGPSGRIGSTSSSSNNTSNIPSNTYSYGSSLNLYSSSSLGRPTSTPRRTNFSSATTPRNMFRDSMARDMPAFSFTPRVPANTLRGSFPATTPGRSLRAPGVELSAREMAKVTSSDLFHMKIPDPDPKLSAEAMTDMIPSELKAGGHSVYANEFLAHLCPPDFNEEQRNQFFCILDLRRLKYAADEVFLKKDWKLNITNFAKEYEKNRSLIMLRYGLYEFKTVKVSKDTFTKWKQDHNIPNVLGEEDEEELMVNPADLSKSVRASKPNGTEGILRTGKRKAQDNIDPNATTSSSQPTKKRTRADGSKVAAADREPLLESSTPSLNKSKRKASRGEGSDQLQRVKQQKPTPAATPSATPSATKAFFEKVANSPAKENETATSSADTPSIKVTQPSLDSASTTSKTSLLFSKPATNGSGSLARSVLESGLKSGSGTAQNNNIFGYLSDASSAKGSGNDNADADAEDTDDSDGQEESESQDASDKQIVPATSSSSAAQPSASLFAPKPANPLLAAASQNASASSSEASDATPGRSLFDRVNKGSDGQPIRMFGNDGAASPFQSAPAVASSATPLFGSKPTSERASPEKEAATSSSSLFGANKTWTPDSPIKFAGGASTTPGKSLFGNASSTTPAATSTTPASSFKFGAATAPAAEKSADDKTPADSSKEATPAAPAATTPSLFGSSSKPAETGSASPSLFGASTTQASAPALTGGSLFGAAATPTTTAPSTLFGKTSTTTPAAPPLFGAPSGASTSSPSLQASTLFGNSSKTDTPSFGQKRSADDDSAPKTTSSLFGNTAKTSDTNGSDEPSAKKTMFGASSSGPAASGSSTPLFSFGAPKANGDADASAAAKPQESKPLFGSTPVGGAAEAPKSQSVSLFGNSTPAAAPASSAPSFSFGGNNASSTPAAQPSGGALFSFGASSTQPQQSTAPAPSTGFSFGGGSDAGSVGSGGSSFTFNAGGAASVASQPFRNPFASGADSSAAGQPSTSFSFGAGGTNGQSSAPSTSMFQFGGGTPAAAPAASTGGLFSFGGGSQTTEPATTPGNSFGNAAPSAGNGSAIFSFGGGTPAQASGTPLFGQQKPAGAPMFNLAPPMGGASSGTNTPFTNLGGASSLATTPATGTPEPGATQDNNTDNSGHQADGDEAPQEQISLIDGGPGEEDEAAVHEVRAKALRLSTGNDESGSESPAAKEKKSPWKTEGVGPLRVLKNKTTGSVRLLLRAEPRGHVALNRALLPDFTYKPEPNAKYVKLTTSNEAGTGLETWMLQVKTKEAAEKLADVLEENKSANKK
ncbi:hypothetical protein Sste5346_000528 [Sporothrix stenoceras]|uniref:RanBD1 domain-containing protein n=1 Tax=Sporothrix stenoceras TaxID=5173 RepID=A0ABR3ZRD6_9PEZI